MSEPICDPATCEPCGEQMLALVAAELRVRRLVRSGTDALVAISHAAGALAMAEAPEAVTVGLAEVADQLRGAVLDLPIPVVVVDGEP